MNQRGSSFPYISFCHNYLRELFRKIEYGGKLRHVECGMAYFAVHSTSVYVIGGNQLSYGELEKISLKFLEKKINDTKLKLPDSWALTY